MEVLIDGVPVALIGVDVLYQILPSDNSLVVQTILVEVAVVLVALIPEIIGGIVSGVVVGVLVALVNFLAIPRGKI